VFKNLKSQLQKNKKFLLSLINFMLFPYVLGHFDDQFCACEFAIVKKNCTAFRSPGENRWGIFDSKTQIGQNVSVISPKDNSFEFNTFVKIFHKEQFNHPIRAAFVEAFIFS
jgi:hypothetical protein